MSMMLNLNDLGLGQSVSDMVLAAEKLEAQARALGTAPAHAGTKKALLDQAAALRRRVDSVIVPVAAVAYIHPQSSGIGRVLIGLGAIAGLGGVAWWWLKR